MAEAAVDLSYRAILGISGVPRILASLAIGRIAASMASIVLVVFAIERYDSPALAGIVVFASTFPAVVMGPIAGALLDRHGRVRLVLVDQLVGAAALGVLAVLAGTDSLPPWLLVVVSGVASFTRPLSVIGLRTTLPTLVPQPLWPRLNALDSNAFVVATLIGPAAAGTVLALAGGAAALAVVAALLALAGLTLVGIPEHAHPSRSAGPLLADAWAGVRYTWRNPTLRGLGGSMACYYGGFGALTITVPVVLLEVLDAGPGMVGVAWSAMAVAGGVAALLAGPRTRIGSERAWLWRAMALTTAGVALLLAPVSPAVVIAALLIVGAMQGPVDIAMFTLRQRRTDPAWFGRAFAVSVALNSAGSPLAAAVAGLLLTIGTLPAVLFALTLFATGALLTHRLVPTSDLPAMTTVRPA